MQVKILHTGDVHLGMAFSRYPEAVRKGLAQARLRALEKMVTEANRQSCQLMVIAGDLFHSSSPEVKLRRQAFDILSSFTGKVLAVLPGNHDYNDGLAELWPSMERERFERMLILNEQRVYPLDKYGLEVDLYPAPCHGRRLPDHRLDWINGITPNPERLAIGIAHGAVEGLSPDLQGAYFYMTIPELEAIPVDIWLLAHSHTRYPDQEKAENSRLLMCGTPEPDGAGDSRYGNAWIVSLDKNGNQVEAFDPSTYRFCDLTNKITCEEDLIALERNLLASNPQYSLVKLKLTGKLERDVYTRGQKLYDQWREMLYYLELEDDLQIELASSEIDQEFTADSFPHRLLSHLVDDPLALQLAYKLIGRAR